MVVKEVLKCWGYIFINQLHILHKSTQHKYAINLFKKEKIL